MSKNEGIIIDLIIFFTLVVMIYTLYDTYNNDLVYVLCPYNNKKYLVRNLEDKDKSALLLAKISEKLKQLVNMLNETYDNDERVQRLKKKFNPNNISETIGGSKYTSYSVNKGEKLVFCLRSKKNEKEFIDENTLFFVALHEIAHIMTKSIGHTDEFWNNFKFLLKEATSNNFYKCVDYDVNPIPYCGIKITNTPLKCT